MSSPELVPVGRGFDTSLGYLAGAEDHWTQRGSGTVCDGTEPVDLLHNGEPAIGMNGTGFGGYHWRKEALRVVEEHPVQDPLYLYYAFQDCHSPQEAPQHFTEMYAQLTDSCSDDLSAISGGSWVKSRPGCGLSTRRVYNAMVSFADAALGNLTAALEAKGMWSNTLMVWHSASRNDVLRGLFSLLSLALL